MAQTYKFGNGTWATKEGSTLAYNDENNNYKPLPFSFERDSIATRVNKEGLIEVVSNNVPRIDYTDSSEGVLLLEPSRSNIITNSEKFVDAPTGGTNMDLFGGTIANDNAISPDGNLTAMKFTISGASALLRIYQSDLSTSLDTTFSLYAKKGTADSLSISITGGTSTDVTLTDEWQRVSVTDTSTTQKFIDVSLSGNTGEYIYIWGFQAEQGYPTSYIPTNGSTVTRLADTASGSGNSEVFNDSEGVLFANVSTKANSEYKRISIHSGSYTNSIVFDFIDTNQLYGKVFVGGSPVATILASGLNIENNNKILLKYKTNDFALWVNGFEVGTDTSGGTPTGLNELSFDLASNQDFYGKTKELGYYNTALTDLELETLTSYRSLSELVTELNLNTL